MKTARFIAPYSVVFVSDPNRRCEIPSDVSKSIVCRTMDCISIWTIAEVDGEVEVFQMSDLSEINDAEGLFCIHDDRIVCDKCCLAITNAEGDSILTWSTADNGPKVSIFVDNLDGPEKIIIVSE